MDNGEFWDLYRKVERWIFQEESQQMVEDILAYYDWIASRVGRPLAENLLRRGLISGSLYDELKDVERIINNIRSYDLQFVKAQLVRILEVLEQAYFSLR